jgi:hypothetical protein
MLVLEATQHSGTTLTSATSSAKRVTCAFPVVTRLGATSVAAPSVCLSGIPASGVLTADGPAYAWQAGTHAAGAWRIRAIASAMVARLDGNEGRSLAFGGNQPKPYPTERTSSPPNRKRD